MSERPCASPIAFPALVDYWLGELEAAREEALEEHLFGCALCTARLEALAALGAGVRKAFREGFVRAVLSPGFIEKIRSQGLRVREYRVPAGGSVECTIAAADDFAVGRLEAPLAGVKRLDLFLEGTSGHTLALHDVPFDAEAGEVAVLPSAAVLKKMPKHVMRVRLVAVDEAGERTLGVYTFNHTPS